LPLESITSIAGSRGGNPILSLVLEPISESVGPNSGLELSICALRPEFSQQITIENDAFIHSNNLEDPLSPLFAPRLGSAGGTRGTEPASPANFNTAIDWPQVDRLTLDQNIFSFQGPVSPAQVQLVFDDSCGFAVKLKNPSVYGPIIIRESFPLTATNDHPGQSVSDGQKLGLSLGDLGAQLLKVRSGPALRQLLATQAGNVRVLD
jgi:hypothetical protein